MDDEGKKDRLEGDPEDIKIVRSLLDLGGDKAAGAGNEAAKEDVFKVDVFASEPSQVQQAPIPEPEQSYTPETTEPVSEAYQAEAQVEEAVQTPDVVQDSTPEAEPAVAAEAPQTSHPQAEEILEAQPSEPEEAHEYVATAEPESAGEAYEAEPATGETEEIAESVPAISEPDEAPVEEALAVEESTESESEPDVAVAEVTEEAEETLYAVDQPSEQAETTTIETPGEQTDEPQLAEDAPDLYVDGSEDKQPEEAESPDDEITEDDIDSDAEVGDFVAITAAKAKEGKEAVEETQKMVESLDGVEEGFLDTQELMAAIKSLKELTDKVSGMSERLEKIEAALKDKGIL